MSIEKEKAEDKEKNLKCPDCLFEENRTDAKFCPKCGYSFIRVAPVNENVVNRTDDFEKSNNRRKYWIIGLLAIIFILLNIVIVGLIVNNNSDNKQSVDATKVSEQTNNTPIAQDNKQDAEAVNNEANRIAEKERLEKEKAEQKRREQERLDREQEEEEEEEAEQARIEEERIAREQEDEDELKQRIAGSYSGFGSNYQIVFANVKVVGENIKVTSGGQTFMLYSSGSNVFENSDIGVKCVFDEGQLMFQNGEGTVYYLKRKKN